ncbi:hypothetical protein BJF78_35580 [Pseudonocardia sp. CNS-139]|nr:hypothetical protein BJF78_35580 [Pseudonocardia sp. CNS-139]
MTPSHSVVTLTGPGGVGKTTLALLVAAAAHGHFPAGTVLVELADVRSAADVVPAIATALGVPDSGTADRVEAVASFVGNRRLLLVLDNIEHVLPCAPAVATLVSVCPALTILTTGRSRCGSEPNVRCGWRRWTTTRRSGCSANG